jgi:hypothetical protein
MGDLLGQLGVKVVLLLGTTLILFRNFLHVTLVSMLLA